MLERYQVHGSLGAGGEARVLLALDAWLPGRKVALKVTGPEARVRLANEFATLRRVIHPHVVRVTDFVATPTACYLVEEYIQGVPLQTWSREVNAIEVAKALWGVAQALVHIHARQLVHLDVTPNNILVSKEGHATLLDFGLTRKLSAEGFASGTPGYVAPEVLRGETALASADIYGFGVTLAVCMGAELTPLGLDLVPLTQTPYLRLVQQCTQVAPASRPDAQQVLDALAKLLGQGSDVVVATALPLVGRDAELLTLREFLASGVGALRVHGAPGVGVSALLEAAADHARVAGMQVVALHGDALAVSSLWRRLGQRGALVGSALDKARRLVLALDQAAVSAPLCVVIDDADVLPDVLHKAVDILSERLVQSRVHVLLGAQSAGSQKTELHIAPLSVDCISTCLAMALARPIAHDQAKHVHALTGGVMQRVHELLENVAKASVPLGALSSEHLTAEELPPLLRALALAPQPLSSAAVELLQVKHNIAASHLADWQNKGWLWVEEGPTYRLPKRLQSSFAPATRDELRSLAHDFESLDERHGAAVLWAQAHEAPMALVHLTALADHPNETWRDAACEVLTLVGAPTLGEHLLQVLGQVGLRTDDDRAVGDASRGLLALKDTAAATLLRAEFCTKRGRYTDALELVAPYDNNLHAQCIKARALYFTGQADEALKLAGQLLGDTALGPHERLTLLDLSGHAYFARGQATQAIAHLQSALELAATLDDADGLGRAQHSLAIVLQRQGRVREALSLYRASLVSADSLAAQVRKLNLATALQDNGAWDEALLLYREVWSLAQATANGREQVRVGVNLANLETLVGDLPVACRRATETLALAEETLQVHAASMSALVLCEAELEREDFVAAQTALQRAARHLASIEDTTTHAEYALLRAKLNVITDAPDAAHSVEALQSLEHLESAAHLKRQVAFVRALGAQREQQVGLALTLFNECLALANHAHDVDLAFCAAAHALILSSRVSSADVVAARYEAERRLDVLQKSMSPALWRTYEKVASRSALLKVVRQGSAKVSDASNPGALVHLLAINRRLAREQETQPLLELILDAAINLLGAERGFLLLRRQDAVQVAVARRFDKQSLTETQPSISRSIAQTVLARGEAVLTTNALADERFATQASVLALRVRSVLCVPLRGLTTQDDPLIGAIYLDHRYQERAFTEDDVTLCESFADQAAIALENARRVDQIRAQEKSLAEQNERLVRFNTQLRLEAAEQAAQAEEALRRLREEGPTLGVGRGFERIVGKSDKLRECLRLVDRFADTDVAVFIHGESGTGKELVARAIHERSSRRERGFVTVNCGAIPEPLIESELFGYKRGAFTGAVRDKTGLFAAAQGGTIFLDEIGEMPAAMQVKLLRVLQEREYRPVGGSDLIRADVRVLSASHQDLQAMVLAGRFREDLFYRLHVVELTLPPLRERREDVIPLLEHFVRKAGGASVQACFSQAALSALLSHDWPGNVRELQNEVQRALALADGLVKVTDLSPALSSKKPSSQHVLAQQSRGSLRDILDAFEKQVLSTTLKRAGWNVRQVAKDLGLSRAALYTRLAKFGIAREE